MDDRNLKFIRDLWAPGILAWVDACLADAREVNRCRWYDDHPSSVCLRPGVEIVLMLDDVRRALCDRHLKRFQCPT
jgi:hypothetical protein